MPHPADRVEVGAPLLDGPEGLGQGLSDLRGRGGHRIGAAPKVGEVVLMENHTVVLEPEPPGQLGELEIAPRRPASFAQGGELRVEPVHLLHVTRVQPEMLGDLVRRDPVKPLKVVEALLGVR